MIQLSMEKLTDMFNEAKERNFDYVAIQLKMDGFDGSEVIINPIKNVDTKLAYYQNTYDDNLHHKFAKGIQIVGYTYGNSFEEIENELF